MSIESKTDAISIRDRASRRRFVRRGAAFAAVLGSTTFIASQSALAADCDSGGPGGKKPEHGWNGSDSDAGANADPTGCGRQRDERPKISKRPSDVLPSLPKGVSVAKISE